MCGKYGIGGLTVAMALLGAGVVGAQDPGSKNGAATLVSVAPPVQGTDGGVTPPPAAPAQKVVPPVQQPGALPKQPTAPSPAAVGITPPPDYVIGPDDILNVVFWRDKEMSADVVVRPDGRITLPLINDVEASGLTPEQLRDRVRSQASQLIEDPSVTVVVKQINSRKVYVTGLVGRPGAYPLSNPITVLQLLSMAGGISEFANDKRIMIMRTEGGKQQALKFNYRDVTRGKNLQQNIQLKPGDTVVVP